MYRSNETKGDIIGDYKIIGNSIGQGSFGKVFLFQHLTTKNYFAAKMLQRDKVLSNPDLKRKFIREVTISKKMSHTNIARLYEVLKSSKNLYLILEYCNGGNLHDVLESNYMLFYKPLSFKLVQHFTKQVVEGLHELSTNNIIHRDLKLQNIMLSFQNLSESSGINDKRMKAVDMKFDFTKENLKSEESFEEILLKSVVKIIDLGFARELEEDGTYSFCGTASTMAPEILKIALNKNLKYDHRVDIWSLGCNVFQLVTKTIPFRSNDLSALYRIIIQGVYKLNKNFNLPLEFLDFVNGLLQVNPDDRLTWSEIIEHPFLNCDVEKFININFQKNKFEFPENYSKLNLTGNKLDEIFSEVFEDINYSQNSEYFKMNANVKHRFLKRFNDLIIKSELKEENKTSVSKDKNKDIIKSNDNLDGNENFNDGFEKTNMKHNSIDFENQIQTIKQDTLISNQGNINDINEQKILPDSNEEYKGFKIFEERNAAYEDEDGFIVIFEKDLESIRKLSSTIFIPN